jgi:glucokinase
VILAGDIGATKTRLGIFAERSTTPVTTATYVTAEFERPAELVDAFLATVGLRPERASFGVAGVVVGRRVPRINLPWDVDADELKRELGLHEATFVNDIEANARGILELGDDDLAVLHPGAADAVGTRAVVSAGTGLGEAALWWNGTRHHAAASEARSRWGRRRRSRSSSIAFSAPSRAASTGATSAPGPACQDLPVPRGGGEAPAPAAIAAAAEADAGSVARAAVDLFVSIYGAREGDVALSYGATGGVYLGGGIAPRLLPGLLDGGFVRAFLAKGRLESFVRRIPVRVVLNADATLIGAVLSAGDVTAPRLAA